MKVNQIKAFNEVMITGSVSEAARNLHRTQPSVSALIASLEQELGFSLFVRQKGRLYPVPEANYLHEECREVLARIERIDHTMKQIRSQSSGELRIVAMPGPSIFFLPDLISRFTQGRDDLRCSLISRGSEEVFQLVAAQQYELGIADPIEDKPLDTGLVDELTSPRRAHHLRL